MKNVDIDRHSGTSGEPSKSESLGTLAAVGAQIAARSAQRSQPQWAQGVEVVVEERAYKGGISLTERMPRSHADR